MSKSIFNQIHRQSGFTLMELMIVIAIVAILAAIALPAYNSQKDAARRAEAQAALSSFAGAMEKEFTTKGTYAEADGDTASETAGDNAVPTIFPSQVPASGTANYNLRIHQANGSSYTVIAIPAGAQVGDGRLEITSTGTRCWYRGNDVSGGTCTNF